MSKRKSYSEWEKIAAQISSSDESDKEDNGERSSASDAGELPPELPGDDGIRVEGIYDHSSDDEGPQFPSMKELFDHLMQFNKQSTMYNAENEQAQRERIEAELGRIRAERVNPQKEAFLRRFLVLHIRLRKITPIIWRRVRVPASTPLSVLHDSVLCPVVGWYHHNRAYMFTVPGKLSSTLGYGPVDDESMNHISGSKTLSPGGIVDSRDVCIGDIVNQVNDKVRYIYDLAEQWEHVIAVDSVEDKLPEGAVAFECLGGERACPPEGVGSMYDYCYKLPSLLDPKHVDHKADMRTVMRAANVEQHFRDRLFDPNAFDLRQVQRRLEKALRAHATKWRQGREGSSRHAAGRKRRRRSCQVCHRSGVQMYVCGRCGRSLYCSRRCQRRDWQNHKPKCVPEQDRK